MSTKIYASEKEQKRAWARRNRDKERERKQRWARRNLTSRLDDAELVVVVPPHVRQAQERRLAFMSAHMPNATPNEFFLADPIKYQQKIRSVSLVEVCALLAPYDDSMCWSQRR